MSQNIKDIDIKAFDKAVEDFYKKFKEELDEKTPEDIFADQVYKEALEEKKDWDASRIQSIEEQNQILKEHNRAHPVALMHNGMTGSEFAEVVDVAWKTKNWSELAKLYRLESTQETFDQFEDMHRSRREYSKNI